MESCSACPAGQYCSIEGLANPSGPCAAGFFCPFDFSSTTPFASLCPKVRDIHICFCCFYPGMLWIPFLVLSYFIVLFVFLIVSLLEKLLPCCLLLMSCWIESCHSGAPLWFPFSHRATTVLKALPWPCLVQQESTSQIQAQKAASLVDLDSTVRRP